MDGQKNHTELTPDLIFRAVKGEPAALQEVLDYYEPYINSLSVIRYKDKDGKIREEFSEDIKAQLQLKYIENIHKCRGIFSVE